MGGFLFAIGIFVIDYLIIYATIKKVGSWGEWLLGTLLYIPGATLAAYAMNAIGPGGETGALLIWSPLVFLCVRAKIEMAKDLSSTKEEFKKATNLQVILGALIVFACMVVFILMFS